MAQEGPIASAAPPINSVGTTQIIDGQVALADMANLATDRLIGRDTAGTGVPEALTVGGGVEFTGSGGIQRSALTGDVTAAAGSGTTAIGTAAVTSAMLRDSAAVSVIGRSANSVGVPADIAAGSDGDILRRAAGAVGFGTVPSTSVTGLAAVATSGSAADLSAGVLPDARMPNLTGDVTTVEGAVATTIANDAVTYAKMQNVSATDRLLGRDTAGAGDVEELTLTSPLSFTGSGGIQWTNPWTTVVLGSDFTTDQATAQDTGLKFTPAVSTTYEVEIHAGLRSGVAGIAPRPGVQWNTGNDDGWALLQFNDLGSVSFVQGNIAAAIAYDPTGPTDATNTYPCTIKAIIVAGAGASGSFVFTLKSETAANAVSCRKGSMLKYRAIAG